VSAASGVGITLAVEAVEEGEQGVGCQVTPGASVDGCGAVEHALFELQVGVQVDARGSLLLVPQPQRDRRCVDAGLEERHRGGVAQDVHGHALCAERRARALRDGDVLGEATFDGIAGQPSAGAGGEQRVGWLALALAQPHAQNRDGGAGERGDALLPPLPQGPKVALRTVRW
jgi:hypothetical protein